MTFALACIALDRTQNFGDAGLTISGTLATARSAQGTMFTPSLPNQVFPFTMTR